MAADERMADRDVCQMIYVGQHPFLPHYLKPGVFVAPGGVEWQGDDLIKQGGKMVPAFLWPRFYAAKPAEPRVPQQADGWKDVLRQLQEGGPASVTEVGQELGWSRGRARYAMTRLVEMGLVEPWGGREESSAPQRWMAKP